MTASFICLINVCYVHQVKIFWHFDIRHPSKRDGIGQDKAAMSHRQLSVWQDASSILGNKNRDTRQDNGLCPQSRFFVITQSWQCPYWWFADGKQKNINKNKLRLVRIELGTSELSFWCSPFWTNLALHVRLRLLGSLFSHTLLN